MKTKEQIVEELKLVEEKSEYTEEEERFRQGIIFGLEWVLGLESQPPHQ